MRNEYVVRKGADFAWLRAHAGDVQTKEWLDQIEKWTHHSQRGVFVNSQELLSLKLDQYTLYLQQADAWFALALYTEIFRENDHILAPGFTGIEAETIVDLGANIGLYTLRMRQNNPKARIIAVEPNPSTAFILRKNILTNGLTGIDVIEKAVVGSERSLALKTVAQASAYSGKYLGLIKKEQRPWVRDEMIAIIEVPAITLEQLFLECSISTIDILKIDIEEMELEVLQSSANVLGLIQRIVVEWHTLKTKQDLISFLVSHHYNLVFEEPRDFGDLYFVNEEFAPYLPS
jgi:FkbM family methyltransferase